MRSELSRDIASASGGVKMKHYVYSMTCAFHLGLMRVNTAGNMGVVFHSFDVHQSGHLFLCNLLCPNDVLSLCYGHQLTRTEQSCGLEQSEGLLSLLLVSIR